MSTHLIPLGLVLAVCGLFPVTAQSLSPAEREALRLKGVGQYAQAEDAFLDLLDRCQDGPRDAAMAEYYALLASLMAVRIGDHDFAKRLSSATASPLANDHPSLRDRLLHISWGFAQRQGNLTLTAEIAAQLGALRRFWILGPFDNERGSGFGSKLPPEAMLDLNAAYDGKNQTLRWRRMTSDGGLREQIPLAAMLRPNRQVLAYASLTLITDQAQDIVLHIGTGGSYKVFLNGREHVSRDLTRNYHSDQDAVTLHLEAGANLLMLKICTETGSFEFSARLRALDGRAVQGIRASLESEDMLRAAQATSSAKRATRPALGARTFFAASVETTDSAADKFRLALLLALDQVEDQANRTDLALLRDVCETMPDFSAARYLLAFTRIRSANRAEEREDNQRRQDYRQLLARDPEHAEALRSLAELELSMSGAVGHCEDLLQRALEINPDFRLGQLMLARLNQRLGLDHFAHRALAAAARPDARGRRSPLALHALLADHIEQKLWHEALEIAARLLAEDYGPASIFAATELFLQIGRPEQALAVLADAELRLPYLAYTGKKLAEIHSARGNLAAGMAALGRWLERCPNDDDALVRMATLHGRLGHAGPRLELLRAALALNPNRKTERRLLEFLEADELPFYAGYQRNYEIVADSDPGPPKHHLQAGDPYYYLLRQVVIHAYRNGTTSTYEHKIIRILNRKGAQDLSQYAVEHFRGEQRARLLTAKIHRADGQILTPQINGSFVRFPPLELGDCIEVQSRVDDLAPSFFGDYFGLLHRFASAEGVPVNRSELTLILDNGRDYRLQTANQAPVGVASEDSEHRAVHQFVLRDIGRRKIELRAPAWTESEPLLRVTTYADWNQFSSWWWNLIKRQSEVSPAMRAKVQELTADLSTQREMIDAIYRFVTTDIRYKAWEFGVHGYKPYSTQVIFERRHGDCKDKSLLLNAMLAEIDIEALPVLIHADPLRSSEDLSLPMIEHFNHCISFLPASGDRPALYLDGTATYHPIDTLPDMDKGARVLVVNQGTGAIQEIPWGPAEENIDAIEYRIELDPEGGAIVDYRHRPTRNQAIWLRQLLGNEPGKHRENLERILTPAFGNIHIEALSTSDALDLSMPMEIDVRFSSEQLVSRQGQGLALRARFGDSSLQQLTGSSERQSPLLIGSPSATDHRIIYLLPPGFTPLNLPNDTELQSRFGSYLLRWSYTQGELSVVRRQTWQQPRIAPEEYREFREYASRVDAADQQFVVVSPGGRE